MIKIEKKLKAKSFFIVAGLVLFIGIQTTAAQAKNIGVAWVGKSGMSNRVVSGFDEKLRELSPSIQIEYRKELGSFEEFETVVRQWEAEKDGMVLLRSNAVKWLAKNKTGIATFIGGCNHPRILGLKNMKGITGVTYHLSKASQYGVFQSIVPHFTSMVLLLEKGHPGSLVDQKETQQAVAGKNIQYNDAFLGSKEEVLETVAKYRGKVSAIVLGNQALIFDNGQAIVAAAGDTPILSYNKNPVKNGALVGFSPDDVKLGKMLAQSVEEVVVKGKDINKVPLKRDPDPGLFINRTTLERFGYTLPKKFAQRAVFFD
nr:ABC transporter substrate binding protein [uncultured Desulfobacter sp.]